LLTRYTESGNRQAFAAPYLASLPNTDADKSNGEYRQNASESRGGVCDKFLPPPIIVFGITASMLALGFYIQAISRTCAGYVCGAGLASVAVLAWLSLLLFIC
jgi:hypothetical protein